MSGHTFTNVMSTKSKKKAPTGIRYTDEQKKEVVDFVIDYNAANGRGGQSVASKKFKVTPLTVAAWIKASGKKAAAKPGKKAKAPKPASSPNSNKKGMRYTPEQKQEVVDFVDAYNAANGRGGQSQAAKKFSLSVLTVSSWLKNAGAKGGSKSSKSGNSAALNAKFASLIEVSDQLRLAERETEKLRAKYDALRASVQALI